VGARENAAQDALHMEFGEYDCMKEDLPFLKATAKPSGPSANSVIESPKSTTWSIRGACLTREQAGKLLDVFITSPTIFSESYVTGLRWNK
jgi:hypothetical protein